MSCLTEFSINPNLLLIYEFIQAQLLHKSWWSPSLGRCWFAADCAKTTPRLTSESKYQYIILVIRPSHLPTYSDWSTTFLCIKNSHWLYVIWDQSLVLSAICVGKISNHWGLVLQNNYWNVSISIHQIIMLLLEDELCELIIDTI